MAMINPHVPGVGRPQPFAGLSPLKTPGPSPDPHIPQPGDHIDIGQSSPAEKPQAPKTGRNWWKAATFATLGTGLVVAGSIAGGAMSPALSAANKPQANVQVQKTPQSAPRTLQQQQSSGVQLERVQFNVNPTVRNFNNAPAALVSAQSQESTESGFVNDINIDRLMHQDGRALYSSEEAEQATLDFHDSAQDDWQTSSRLRPAGNAGKYVSVSESTSITGQPTQTRLRTVDSESGNVVNLSELVSPEHYQKMAKDVLSGLNSLQGLQYRVDDLETLDSHMNNGFALHQSRDGQTKITIGIPSHNPNLGNKLAEFTFTLPANALH
jgi:hypothetical protein